MYTRVIKQSYLRWSELSFKPLVFHEHAFTHHNSRMHSISLHANAQALTLNRHEATRMLSDARQAQIEADEVG